MRVSLNIVMSLYELNINQTAKIGNLANSNDSVSRLSEMGLIPGSEIRIVKKNPFGGPVQLKLHNSYIVIRKEDAQLIEITIS